MNDTMVDLVNETTSSVNVEFILLLLVEIISLICTTLILIYTYFHWQIIVSKALHNHAILLIIIISFAYVTLDLPFTLSSYRLGYDLYRSFGFCQWWYWIDYTLLAMSLHVTAVASLQRYILVFKSYLLRAQLTRWLCHYFPLCFCLIYSAVFYVIVIFFYPCDNVSDYTEELYCASPCYTTGTLIIQIDWIINCVVPMAIIIITYTVFISWMVFSMRTLTTQPRHIRKKHKKLTLQLFAFAVLFIVGWAPSTIISLASLFSFNDQLGTGPGMEYFYFISYFICPLQPLICLCVLPEPFRFFYQKLRRCRRRLLKVDIVPMDTNRMNENPN